MLTSGGGSSTNPTPASWPGSAFASRSTSIRIPFVSSRSPRPAAAGDGVHGCPADTEPNGKTVVLFHGKAFGGYYFRNVIEALTESGYRVVAPDQIGWGKSAKPDIHYSFQLLAANTAALLDHLGVGKVASWATRPAE